MSFEEEVVVTVVRVSAGWSRGKASSCDKTSTRLGEMRCDLTKKHEVRKVVGKGFAHLDWELCRTGEQEQT